MTQIIDIAYDAVYPGSALSNFSDRRFEFDGVNCTAEGLLQSLKFSDLRQQREVCAMGGRQAKSIGVKQNSSWQLTQRLFWKGYSIDRHGQVYQVFLDRIYQAIANQCPDFRVALLATGDAKITHSVGCSDPASTVLTEAEFCSRLMRLRQTLRQTGQT